MYFVNKNIDDSYSILDRFDCVQNVYLNTTFYIGIHFTEFFLILKTCLCRVDVLHV